MKAPYPKAKVRVRVGAMSASGPSYTMEELEAQVGQMEAETAAANAANPRVNAKAIWDKFNRRTRS